MGRLASWGKGICEYSSILNAAAREGWIGPLAAAHLTPCTREESNALLAAAHLPGLRVAWRERSSGRTSRRKGIFRITLPRDPLIPGERNHGSLRVGLVLHEAAHVLGFRQYGTFGHDERFRQLFRHLLIALPWRTLVAATCSDYPALYARHRGPYSLLLSTATEKKVKGETVLVPGTNRNKGPMSAEEAHDTARMLVGDPRDNVTAAFVFSDTEGQFIGAYYERGQDIPAWDEARAVSAVTRLAPTAPSETEPLVHGDEGDVGEPVRGVDADGAVPAQPDARSAKPRPSALPRMPPPARKAVALQAATGAAEWPKSRGPQILREWFAAEPGRRATVPDIVAACGPALTEAGIQFPASLISRLKQGGFLVPATPESNDGQEGTAD